MLIFQIKQKNREPCVRNLVGRICLSLIFAALFDQFASVSKIYAI